MKVTLSTAVSQDQPVAFMVFAHQTIDVDYMLFPYENEARDYAFEQEEKSNMPEDSWPIYALWATDWPKQKRRETTVKETVVKGTK